MYPDSLNVIHLGSMRSLTFLPSAIRKDVEFETYKKIMGGYSDYYIFTTPAVYTFENIEYMPKYYDNILTYEAYDYNFTTKRTYELFVCFLFDAERCNHVGVFVKADDGQWYYYDDMDSGGPKKVSETEVNDTGCYKKSYGSWEFYVETYFYRIKKDQTFPLIKKNNSQHDQIQQLSQLLITLKTKLLRLLQVVMSFIKK